MRLDIDVTLNYRLGPSRAALLSVELASDVAEQSVSDESLHIPGAQISRIEGEAGVGQRVWASLPDDLMSLRYNANVEITRPAIALAGLTASPLKALPAAALTFLRPSRYCPSDRFVHFVARRFDRHEGGAKIAAMRDWIASRLTYSAENSTPSTTALDTFAMREGVCRDYAHLLCAFARAANIPARYASVYGPDVTPMDFHAVSQVWLGGAWHLVDASMMSTAEETAIIAVGRDACDVAFMETPDAAVMIDQRVRVARG